MSSADQQEKHAPTPLDAEREELRKVGYSEAEISQILIARTLNNAQQSASVVGQGVMSNVLSSIVAVASHARMLIPTFRTDVATVFDGTATASARAGATASLAVKAVVVVVLGYAAWQEWQQHIIYATQIAEQQARKLSADAARAEAESRAATGRPLPLPGYTQAAPLSNDDLLGKCRKLKVMREAPGPHASPDPVVQEKCASLGVDLGPNSRGK
jgi:hypothetical protein